MAQYREVEEFTKFVLQLTKQLESCYLGWTIGWIINTTSITSFINWKSNNINILCVNGFLDKIPVDKIKQYESILHNFLDKSKIFEDDKRSLRENLNVKTLNAFLNSYTAYFIKTYVKS